MNIAQKFIKEVEAAFEANPHINTFFVTSDGQCFTKVEEAARQGRELNPPGHTIVQRHQVELLIAKSDAADNGEVVSISNIIAQSGNVETATPPADETATPPADETATPPADETATPPADQTAPPPADQTAPPPADETTTPSAPKKAR